MALCRSRGGVMRIDDNAEALAMMKRALGSLEAKIREAYNKGYQDGVKSMVAEEDEPTWEQVKEYCYKRCYEIVDRRWLMKCMYCTNRKDATSPTDCAWK